MEKEAAKSKIKQLMDEFAKLEKEGKTAEYNEKDVEETFIFDFFEAMGWNRRNIDEVKRQKRTPKSLKVDYTLRLNKKDVLLYEIKKFDVRDGLDGHYDQRGGKELTFSQQAIDYGWQLKVPWVVLTNFKETRLYYSFVKNPEAGLQFKLTYDQYLDQFDKLWILSKNEVVNDSLEKLEYKKDRLDINEELLKDLIIIRHSFSVNFHKKNPEVTNSEIDEAVYTLLNRMTVFRVCEDRDLMDFNTLYSFLQTWKKTDFQDFYFAQLNSIFKGFGGKYNTTLFVTHPSEKLHLDNEVIEKAIDILYKYNFDIIPDDVLGAIYEDYLSRVFKAEEKGVELTEETYESKAIRKKEGIYYTPTFVVEYVVREALAAYLVQFKKPTELSKVKICDPSCGSGSFLIKAFDIVSEWYEEFNQKRKDTMDDYIEADYYFQKHILEENLYGVDLDERAAQIAAINVFFKGVKKDVVSPQMLKKNIKIGNSIMSPDEISEKIFETNFIKKNFFDWETEFPFKFDVILGNPPHGAELESEERKYFKKKYQNMDSLKNTASIFIEQSYRILKPKGILALVLPKSLLFAEGWQTVRRFILDNFKIIELIDLGKGFKGVKLEQAVLIAEKKISNEMRNSSNE